MTWYFNKIIQAEVFVYLYKQCNNYIILLDFTAKLTQIQVFQKKYLMGDDPLYKTCFNCKRKGRLSTWHRLIYIHLYTYITYFVSVYNAVKECPKKGISNHLWTIVKSLTSQPCPRQKRAHTSAQKLFFTVQLLSRRHRSRSLGWVIHEARIFRSEVKL